MSAAYGQQITQATIDTALLTGPTEDLVDKTIMQLAAVPGFVSLFGPYKAGSQQQRWANYDRFDWSIRQLPAICVYEGETETKDSDNAFLRGTVNVQVFWPASFRRSDLARVPTAFKGALHNFFSSKYVSDMLDELYYIQRPMKVSGLNEFGKMMDWSPNIEGLIESDVVPVTLVSVRYRIDLRSWYRALEFDYRTKDAPFTRPLSDLTRFQGQYDGTIKNDEDTQDVILNDGYNVTNP